VTHDGGRSWKLRADDHRVPSSGYLASIAFTDDHKGLMTTNRGGLLATEDGGRSWRMLLLTDDATDVVAMQRLGQGTLIVALLNGAILRSSDAGKHWRGIYPHSLPPPEEISFSTPPLVAVVSSSAPYRPAEADGAQVYGGWPAQRVCGVTAGRRR
jgi:photosystem II stability/assembly factor-like uncharacterized protein